jgi:tripartite-type tricarboxylate transporter receptor subunit TctC
MGEGSMGIKKSGWVLNSPAGIAGYCMLLFASLFCVDKSYGAEFPNKPIQLVCPFAPGGGTDVIARIISKKLTILFGQPVIVVNKGGGGGTIGIQSVAAAPADGYTLVISAPTILLSPLTIPDLPFTFRSFTPITVAVSMPAIINVHKDAPWKTLEELIADAKKNPGKFTFSSTGPGTMQHLAGELFKIATGTDLHIFLWMVPGKR